MDLAFAQGWSRRFVVCGNGAFRSRPAQSLHQAHHSSRKAGCSLSNGKRSVLFVSERPFLFVRFALYILRQRYLFQSESGYALEIGAGDGQNFCGRPCPSYRTEPRLCRDPLSKRYFGGLLSRHGMRLFRICILSKTDFAAVKRSSGSTMGGL